MTKTRFLIRSFYTQETFFVEDVPERVAKQEVVVAKRIRELREEIVNAKDDSLRSKLAADLQTELEKVFDADISKRDAELTRLEERMQALRKTLDKRSQARDRIVRLQIETALLESEGLSFPSIRGGAGKADANGAQSFRP